ncbi:MAG: ABC transporter ATP-binding protein, partial [Eubacteriales bacterium]|nr:ABC transporter ATP-binding protein [Eubacteriales bacterium]
IARAIVNSPHIILADEPTGSLDSKNAEEVIQLLKKLVSEGKTLIMVTHDQVLAEQCSRQIRIVDGMVADSPEQ